MGDHRGDEHFDYERQRAGLVAAAAEAEDVHGPDNLERYAAGEKRVDDAVRELLAALGQDVTREGLAGTPARVRRFWRQFLNPAPFRFTTFDAEGTDEMIVQCGIPFYSVCEHHLVPFFGTAAVAYVPDGKIVGLSKLARCVQSHAGGLQNQERITTAVADQLLAALRPRGVGVVLRARHLCMEMRGARVHDVWTVTSKMAGAFRDNHETRAEFLRLATGVR